MSAAKRRYNRRVMLMGLIFVVIMLACTTAVRTYAPTGALLAILSLLPALPLIVCIALIGVYLREERDEYIRNQMADAMIGALGMTLAITTVWGFLEEAEVVGHFRTVFTFPLWAFCLAIWQYGHGRIDRARGGAA